MRTPGRIELERAVDSIRIGSRQRVDLGDVDALADSIDRHGLLQPITVTPDGVLVCGARRLAALRQLGIRTVNVWVRAGISDRLGQLLAEQDENTLHKPLTPTESASLYAELKVLLAEDAARRQEASRFGHPRPADDTDGAATLAAPSPGSPGDSRAQAAMLVTGRRSYTTLERIGELQRIASDDTADPSLRQQATTELASIDEGAPVMPAIRRLNVHRNAVRPTPTGETTSPDPPKPPTDTHLPLRAFVYLWNDLRMWWERYDVDALAADLTDAQWTQFEETLAGTVAFADRLRASRNLAMNKVG